MSFDIFDENFYLSNYSDVQAAVNAGIFTSGLQHFQQYGLAEGRVLISPFYDEQFYLQRYSDVAEAVYYGGFYVSGLQHFIVYGEAEGRSGNPYAVEDSGRGTGTPLFKAGGAVPDYDLPGSGGVNEWNQDLRFDVDWSAAANVEFVDGQASLPLEIYDDAVDEYDDYSTIEWTTSNSAPFGFSQELYTFSENDDVNSGLSVGTTVNISLSLDSPIKAARIIIFDSDFQPLKGDAANNSLSGGNGNDIVFAREGDDRVDGKNGNDSLYGEAGNDRLLGSSGSDYLNGDIGNDYLSGGLGNDTLDGGFGSDTLIGGRGNDTYVIARTIDIITEYAKQGIDTVESSISFILSDNLENLTLTGSDDISGTGNALDNTIVSYGDSYGDNRENTLIGGEGNDTYIVYSRNSDTITEYPNEGIDTVESSDSFTLGNNLENLTLTGDSYLSDGTGNALNNNITGNDGDNSLTGEKGTDTLSGGKGDDTYTVDTTTDTITEFADAGVDTVQSSVSLTLGNNLENLTLTGSNNISGTGNALDNTITSNDGEDTLSGGKGNDTYIVNSTTDIISEYADEGVDTVQSSDSFTLSDNLENLTLTGSSNISGTGNALDNTITVYTYGSNTLSGGKGNDAYIVNNSTDTITEYADEGVDTVLSSGNFTLGDNLENLTLIGSSNISGTGNALDNTITNDNGDVSLEGGLGIDTLAGGGGNDTYIVDSTTDTITEFADAGVDTVQSSGNFTLGDNLENLTLTGSSNISGTGNTFDNTITGNDGRDTLNGGQGNDTYIVNSTTDTITESAGEGVDTVQSAVSFTLGDNLENLTLTGSNDVSGTGNALDNTINSNYSYGSNTLSGGKGNDTYIVDSTTDTILEYADEGVDTVESSVSFTLNANLENLKLTGSSGNGNALDNVITSNDGNNSLEGGLGIDTLAGGGGNDTYIVDSTTDTITESAGEGVDTVQSSVSFTLGDNLENLTLIGSSDVSGSGNALDNTITGNDGHDTLVGGEGNDTYIVNSTTDTISESAVEGVDIVQSAVSFTLGSNLENLTLTGSSDVSGTGNALDNTITSNDGRDTLSGGEGNDTYIVDSTTDTIIEFADAGVDTVQSSVSFTLGDNLENLTLTGSSNISGTGNALDNTIASADGDDSLEGGLGIDTLIGGEGNDTYIVDTTTDTITEDTYSGEDTVQSSVSLTLSDNLENLTLTGSSDVSGTGNALDNTITGNDGHDTLVGGEGNDTYIVNSTTDTITESVGEGVDTVQSAVSFTLGDNLEKLTLTGSSNISGTGNAFDNTISSNDGEHTLSGGAGNDTYIVDSPTDTVIESADAGVDTVESSVSFLLGDNLESLTLTGNSDISGTGNALSNTIVGNYGNSSLYGVDGNDTIESGYYSDSGNALIGGKGDDTYIVNNSTTDTITEFADEGIDTVQSSDSFTLADNLENLTLTTGVYSYGSSGTGNTLDNTITGNSKKDSLEGGLGIDTLIGKGGDDTYIVDSTTDTITEFADAGVDTVQSSVSFTLGENLENLTLTSSSNISGTGNAFDNTITGNDGENTLIGGGGNDTYIINSTTNTITEYADEGVDTVQSSVSFTLGTNLENLTLWGSSSIDITGTGNTLDNAINGAYHSTNFLYGGQGSDTLVGRNYSDKLYGEVGNDTLTGDTGADTFIFYSPLEGIDTITDFDLLEEDKIQVDDMGFGIGQSEYDRFKYDRGTGALYFDETQFALLQLDLSFVPSLSIIIV